MGAQPSVLLAVDHDSPFARGIWRGVMAYLHPAKRWSLHLAAPDGPLPIKPTGVIASLDNAEQRAAMRRLRVPIVAVSDSPFSRGYPTVTIDNVATGRVGAEYFAEQGFTRFAFVDMLPFGFSANRRRGFERAVAEAGFAAQAIELGTGFDGRGTFLRGMPDCEADDEPLAVMACNDWSAWRVFEECRRRGLRIPQQVALLGVDDDEGICTALHPPVSSLKLPFEQVGYHAASLLEGLMNGDRPPSAPLLLPPVGITVRASSAHAARMDESVSAALRFIHQNADKAINVEDIIGGIHVSRRSLERKFRKLIGRTPLEELHRIRIEQAKHLLARTALPVGEVARRAGFVSAAHFSTIFRSRVGVSPKDFRAVSQRG